MMRSQDEENQGKASSRFQAFRSSMWFIGFTIFSTAFTDGFLYGMVVPVLPFSLVQRSGVRPGDVQFWHSALLITFGAAMIVSCAVLSWSTQFNYPRRLPFVVGAVANIASTVMFMLVSNTTLLIISRLLQGFASGFWLCAGLALIAEIVPTEQAGSWIGFTVSGQDVGILVSPLLAGIIYEKAGYYMVFVMGLVLLAVVSAMVLVMDIDDHSDAPSSIVDSNGNADAPRDPTETTTLLRSSTSKNKGQPAGGFLVTFHLLAYRPIATAIYGSLIAIVLVTTFDGTLPLYVQQEYHWNSGLAGTSFLPVTLPSIFAPAIGALSSRYGSRIVALFGIVVTVICEALMALTTHNTLAAQIGLYILLFGVGVGYNSFLVALATNVSAAVETIHKDRPDTTNLPALLLQAYTLEGYAFAIGIMIGPLIGGVLLQATSWGVECGVVGVIVATVAIPVFLFTRP